MVEKGATMDFETTFGRTCLSNILTSDDGNNHLILFQIQSLEVAHEATDEMRVTLLTEPGP
jgi:hypothetical protein